MNVLFRAAGRYVAARLMEASTYRNLVMLVGGGWAASHGAQVDALVPMLLAIAGFIGTVLPDWFGASKPRATPSVTPASPVTGSDGPDTGRDSAPRLREPLVLPDLEPPPGWNG